MRWYWDHWQAVKSDSAVGEPLTYQHLDFLTVRYQRQPGGPTHAQVAELAALRAQLADDRMREAMGAERLPVPTWDEASRGSRLTAMAWLVIAAIGTGSLIGWLVS